MDLTTTDSASLTLTWANELLGGGNPAAFLVAPGRFVSASRNGDSLALTLGGDQPFGLGLGPNPPVDPRWTSCAIDNSSFGDHLGQLGARDEWDFYSINVALTDDERTVEVIRDDDVVTRLLHEHAPQSQVWPGNTEIVHWYGVRSVQGTWASIAALVRWESGLHVLSSVATVSDLRGRGFAPTLVKGVITEARHHGATWLGLGVGHWNLPAQRVYQRVGFSLRANFTNYSTG